jgi:hypothetical protein
MPAKKAATREDFQATFEALKDVLRKYEPKCVVHKDDAQWYYLNTTKIGANKQPTMFAATRIGKNYVSFHLMPLYCCAELVDGMPEFLRARMQGKACLNFKAIKPEELKAIAQVTEKGFRIFKKAGYA